MSSVIGSLRVNLGLDSANFVRGARGVDGPLKRMKSQFTSVVAAAALMGAAIGAAALKGASEIDEAAKSARRLDASIGGFRALEIAAGEAGVNVSGLTNDVQTMNRELASIGKSGNGQRALDALGLSIEDLEGKDADEKLATIADRVKALGLDAGEATAVLRDLGVRNREMALLVLQGGDALRRARTDVEDYGLAVSEVDASRIEGANDAIGRLGLITQYAGQQLAIALVPAMGQMAQAMTDSLKAGGLLRGMIDGFVGNLGELAGIVSVAVAVVGTRYVYALVAARVATIALNVSTLGFIGSLRLLKGAMISTGIGAVVVIAGVLVGKFYDLVSAAGGFGAALGLVADVGREAWDRMGLGMRALHFKADSVWQGIQATIFGAVGATVGIVADGVNKYVGLYVGAYKAVVAGWGLLPQAFKNLGALAINGLIDIVENGIQALYAPINAIASFFDMDSIQAPDLSGWKVTEDEASGIGAAVGAAFSKGLNGTYLDTSGIQDHFTGMQETASQASEIFSGLGTTFSDAAKRPFASWETLKGVMSETGEAATDAGTSIDAVTGSGAVVDEAAGGGAGGAGEAVGALTGKVDALKSAADDMKSTFKDAFKGIVTGAKSLGDVVKDVLNKIADKLLDSAFDGLWGALAGGSGGGGGLLGGLLGSLFPSANGNVFSGGGNLQAYANGGVVSGPTIFPMSGSKTGLMGEAGPEAIMPLTRIGGKLGVRTAGGGHSGGEVVVRLALPKHATISDVHQISGDMAVRVVAENNENMAEGNRG